MLEAVGAVNRAIALLEIACFVFFGGSGSAASFVGETNFLGWVVASKATRGIRGAFFLGSSSVDGDDGCLLVERGRVVARSLDFSGG